MKKRSVFERLAAMPHLVWSLLFIIAPLIFVIYFAFTDRDGMPTIQNIIHPLTLLYESLKYQNLYQQNSATIITLNRL